MKLGRDAPGLAGNFFDQPLRDDDTAPEILINNRPNILKNRFMMLSPFIDPVDRSFVVC
jgi:hypothetical protein